MRSTFRSGISLVNRNLPSIKSRRSGFTPRWVYRRISRDKPAPTGRNTAE